MTYNFIHIPKVAGSSLFKLIGGYHSIAYCGHIRAVDVQFFCFTRNPYDRLVDAYVYLIGGGGNVQPDLSYQQQLFKYKDFSDFVFHIESDNLLYEIIHIRSMSYYACDDNGKVIIQNIFKIEEPDKIDEFLLALGFDKLSDIKVNVTQREHYIKYLTHENIAKINRIYKRDFELFGYEML